MKSWGVAIVIGRPQRVSGYPDMFLYRMTRTRPNALCQSPRLAVLTCSDDLQASLHDSSRQPHTIGARLAFCPALDDSSLILPCRPRPALAHARQWLCPSFLPSFLPSPVSLSLAASSSPCTAATPPCRTRIRRASSALLACNRPPCMRTLDVGTRAARLGVHAGRGMAMGRDGERGRGSRVPSWHPIRVDPRPRAHALTPGFDPCPRDQ